MSNPGRLTPEQRTEHLLRALAQRRTDAARRVTERAPLGERLRRALAVKVPAEIINEESNTFSDPYPRVVGRVKA